MAVDLEDIQNSYPFLTLLQVGKEEVVGIVQNADIRVISIYVYELMTAEHKETFLENGSNWWWESNRKIPINIFIGKDFDRYRPYLRTFSIKEAKIVFGPITRLSDLSDSKRVRRKTVQLLRNIK